MLFRLIQNITRITFNPEIYHDYLQSRDIPWLPTIQRYTMITYNPEIYRNNPRFPWNYHNRISSSFVQAVVFVSLLIDWVLDCLLASRKQSFIAVFMRICLQTINRVGQRLHAYQLNHTAMFVVSIFCLAIHYHLTTSRMGSHQGSFFQPTNQRWAY